MDNTAWSFSQRADILVVNSERWWSWSVGRSYRMHWGNRFYFGLSGQKELLWRHGISQRPEGSRQLAMQRWGMRKSKGRMPRHGWAWVHNDTQEGAWPYDHTVLGAPQERNCLGFSRNWWITVVLLDQSFSNLDCQHFKSDNPLLQLRGGYSVQFRMFCNNIDL